VKLVGASGSRDLTLGCKILNIYENEFLSVWWVCLGCIWTEGGFTLALVQGYGAGSEVLLEQVQFNFSSPNKFIIVLQYGLLVDNNILLKMCVFKEACWLH
jgi:hypothetical protein